MGGCPHIFYCCLIGHTLYSANPLPSSWVDLRFWPWLLLFTYWTAGPDQSGNSWTQYYQKTQVFCTMLFTVASTGGFLAVVWFSQTRVFYSNSWRGGFCIMFAWFRSYQRLLPKFQFPQSAFTQVYIYLCGAEPSPRPPWNSVLVRQIRNAYMHTHTE